MEFPRTLRGEALDWFHSLLPPKLVHKLDSLEKTHYFPIPSQGKTKDYGGKNVIFKANNVKHKQHLEKVKINANTLIPQGALDAYQDLNLNC